MKAEIEAIMMRKNQEIEYYKAKSERSSTIYGQSPALESSYSRLSTVMKEHKR